MDDSTLLRQYTRNNSEEAFAAVVARHINLVFSVALRQAGDPHHAEEITQAVFIILAKKAGELRHDKALSSWLFQATRLTANNFVRSEIRRQRREKEAYTQTTLNESGNEVWPGIAPLLDAAVAGLNEKDRRAILLRFYEGMDLCEVGLALGASEEAAKKRVNRAVEKLRFFFKKRGVVVAAAALAAAISANSVQAAPAMLAKTTTSVAFAKGTTASTSILTLIKGALKIMAWSKTQTTIVATVAIILAAGTTAITVKEIQIHRAPIWQRQLKLALQKPDGAAIENLPPQVAILPSLPSTVSSGFNNAGIFHGKIAGVGKIIPQVVAAAYGYQFHMEQLVFLSPVSEREEYDFISTLPRGQTEALRKELKQKLGLVGHLVTNEVNCLVLKVKSRHAPGLKRSSLPEETQVTDGSFSMHDQGLWQLVDFLADQLGTVVVDQTGLDGDFDIDFSWDKTPGGLRQALPEQTGLELVPAKEPVKFLLVEDVNHPVAGIGAGLALDNKTQQLKITSIFPNSSAKEAGLYVGSVIQKIDGISVGEKSLSECVGLIHGRAGTKVQLEIVAPDGSETNTVELMRQKIQW
jgi:uncharacterized protein (TIGR03435 family)